MQWQIIDSGRLPAKGVMAKDAELLDNLALTSKPILHLYEWESDCLTYGYFINPSQFLNIKELEDRQIQAARRPTGGGIIFHLTDFAFSILIPAQSSYFSLNTLENYAFVNQIVIKVISRLFNLNHQPELLVKEQVCLDVECHSFCMAKPTQYDVMLKGKKVGGAAQRRTKNGFLHQGSISLALPPLDLLQQVLKKGSTIIEAMQLHTYPLLGSFYDIGRLLSIRSTLKCQFIDFIGHPK